MENEFEYRLRTILGFLMIIVSIVLGIWLAWWLNSGGNVLGMLHAMRVSLPGWAWDMMRYFFSISIGAVFMSVSIAISMLILRGRR
jgi:hypothetical protein